RSPYGVTLDNAGNFYIGDRDNQRIRRVDTQGMVKTVAGNARFRQVDDNTPATRSYFFFPRGMVFDPAGNLYVADSGLKRIRNVPANGAFSTFAGPDSRNCCIVDGQRQDPLLGIPIAMVVDGRQNLVFTESTDGRVRRISPAGVIDTIAGADGDAGYNGD